MSSLWVPMPTAFPSSSTIIRSASMTVPTLWATITLVVPAMDAFSDWRSALSVLKSRAENESSRSRASGSLHMARATVSLCFCPPETFFPYCESIVSVPSGRWDTNSSAWAILSARRTSSCVLEDAVSP